MDSAPDLSSCDELWLSQITTMGWEKAYKTACEQVDAQLAKITHLEMQLAAIETQNICLTRENQRLNLTMRHLAPWGTTTPASPPLSAFAVGGSDDTLVGCEDEAQLASQIPSDDGKLSIDADSKLETDTELVDVAGAECGCEADCQNCAVEEADSEFMDIFNMFKDEEHQ